MFSDIMIGKTYSKISRWMYYWWWYVWILRCVPHKNAQLDSSQKTLFTFNWDYQSNRYLLDVYKPKGPAPDSLRVLARENDDLQLAVKKANESC